MKSDQAPQKLDHIARQYRDAFAQFGRSPASVLVPKGRQDLRFGALTRGIERDHFSLLDYGCGLADLKGYLDNRFSNFDYTGVDLVTEFIDDNRHVYPDATFMQVSAPSDVTRSFDYVAMSGIFNILYVPNREAHRDIIRNIITELFAKCEVAMVMSFMTDRVDFQAADAYHENTHELMAFCTQHLSSRWLLDQSYMPYEFTVTVFKDTEIVRPANIYRET
jgi:trans-aconitate methyltransferase